MGRHTCRAGAAPSGRVGCTLVTATGGYRGFSGTTLLQSVAGILLLAVVVPPGLATLVNRSRIDRAQQEVRRLAEALQDAGLLDRPVGQGANELLALAGPGDVPEATGVRQWVDGPVVGLGGYVSGPLRSDPWGNRYLVNIGVSRRGAGEEAASDPRALWVLSAGPNGLVETPYAVSAVSAIVHGDDVAARIE